MHRTSRLLLRQSPEILPQYLAWRFALRGRGQNRFISSKKVEAFQLFTAITIKGGTLELIYL